jgi:acyl dehydratase
MSEIALHEYVKLVGQEVGLSRWFEVGQKRIDAFADVTEDWQFIHIDPEAAAKTPFGGTVAHGFLTLSLMPAMAYDALPKISDQAMAVNYGFEKVRLVSPVRSGRRVRGRFLLKEVTQRSDKAYMLCYEATVEIEGELKPALKAEWLGISYAR